MPLEPCKGDGWLSDFVAEKVLPAVLFLVPLLPAKSVILFGNASPTPGFPLKAGK